MAALGMLFILLTIIAWLVSRKDVLESYPLLLKIMLYAIRFHICNTGGVDRRGGGSAAVDRLWIDEDFGCGFKGYNVRTGHNVSHRIYPSLWVSSNSRHILLFKNPKKGPEEDSSVLVRRPGVAPAKQEADMNSR